MLQVLDLTGAQLDVLLEQQFQDGPGGSEIERILAPSHNLTYTLDRLAPRGERIRSITIDGEAVDPERVYKVVMNNFLAGGGDGFTVCTEAHGLVGAGKDLDASTAIWRPAHEWNRRRSTASVCTETVPSRRGQRSPRASARVGHAALMSSCQ